MRRQLISVVLMSWLLTACGGPAVEYVPLPTPVPTSTAAPTAPPTHTPVPVAPPTISLDTTEIQRQLAQVEKDTANMRGLKLNADVPEHFISSAELKYNMMQQTLKEYTPEEARRDATRLWLLMFIDDRSIDFLQLEIEFAGDAILGYYDHRTKELFVRTDQPTLSPGAQETLAHEIIHTLQDQHHDLGALLPEGLDHDQSMAIRSLVEGDATVSGLFYASRYMSDRDFARIFEESGHGAPPVPGRAPVYLQEGWQFPYAYGSDFILEIAGAGNYKPVDAAFKDPPRTTEQIMHPEKYFAKPREGALPVALPALTDTLGAGWTFRETDTLGEFDLDVMLRENFVDDIEASMGWGGARFDLYENSENVLAIMGSRWDTPKDLDEFEEALRGSFKLFHKQGDLWTDRGRYFGLKRSGDTLMFVSGTDPAAVQRVFGVVKP